jgi:hypothetical protein
MESECMYASLSVGGVNNVANVKMLPIANANCRLGTGTGNSGSILKERKETAK